MMAARVEALDSLRFLAASAVMIAHFRSLDLPARDLGFFFSGLLDARSAVALFFVLSGLVLHLSWAGAWPQLRETWKFYLRRWFRIYPLYYTALIIALGVTQCLPLGDCPVLRRESATLDVITTNHADAWQWLHHLLLISPGLDSTFIVPPVWTLAEEMRVSLIFPWLSLSVARAPRMPCLVVIGILFVLSPWLSAWIAPAAGLLPLFAIGAWVAQHHRTFATVNTVRGWLIATAGVALYLIAGELHWRLQQLAVGLGSALMMLAVLVGPQVRKALSHRLLIFGGRCSYGIYILHFPILMVVTWLVWRNGWPEWMRYFIGVPVTAAAATLFFHAVETPMIRLGRRAYALK